MKRLTCALLALTAVGTGVLTLGLTACGSKNNGSKGLIYERNEQGTYTLVDATLCHDEEITVASVVDGVPVTEIGEAAFYDLRSVKKIYLPDTLELVAYDAFEGCTNLQYNVVDNMTFLGSREVDSLVLCQSYSSSALVTIPESVVYIMERAFYENFDITDVQIGANVKGIGASAFEKCTALTNLEMNESLIHIGDYAFADCTELTEGLLPDTTIDMGVGVFRSCTNLTKASVSSSLKEIPDETFYECTNFSSFSFPSQMERIGKAAFYDCQRIGNIPTNALPTTLVTIDDEAFWRCSHLTSISLSHLVNLTTIGDDAFANTALKQVIIPDGVTTIGDSVFSTCEDLTAVQIGENVTTLTNEMFAGCSKLSRLYFKGEKVTTIQSFAFHSCFGLTTLILPASITKIETNAFLSCLNLTSIYYSGEDASKVQLDDNALEEYTTLYAFSLLAPEKEGFFWHYGDDKYPTAW